MSRRINDIFGFSKSILIITIWDFCNVLNFMSFSFEAQEESTAILSRLLGLFLGVNEVMSSSLEVDLINLAELILIKLFVRTFRVLG